MCQDGSLWSVIDATFRDRLQDSWESVSSPTLVPSSLVSALSAFNKSLLYAPSSPGQELPAEPGENPREKNPLVFCHWLFSVVLTLPIPAREIESGRKLGTVQDFLTEESEFEVNITQRKLPRAVRSLLSTALRPRAQEKYTVSSAWLPFGCFIWAFLVAC